MAACAVRGGLVVALLLVATPIATNAQGTNGGRASGSSTQSAPAAGAAPGMAAAYSEEQATRGEGTFRRYCLECHTRSDMASADFRAQWNGRSALDLFELIRSTMPESSPGALSRDEYADIVAYFLRINGVPAGRGALTADTDGLKRARLELHGTGQR